MDENECYDSGSNFFSSFVMPFILLCLYDKFDLKEPIPVIIFFMSFFSTYCIYYGLKVIIILINKIISKYLEPQEDAGAAIRLRGFVYTMLGVPVLFFMIVIFVYHYLYISAVLVGLISLLCTIIIGDSNSQNKLLDFDSNEIRESCIKEKEPVLEPDLIHDMESLGCPAALQQSRRLSNKYQLLEEICQDNNLLGVKHRYQLIQSAQELYVSMADTFDNICCYLKSIDVLHDASQLQTVSPQQEFDYDGIINISLIRHTLLKKQNKRINSLLLKNEFSLYRLDTLIVDASRSGFVIDASNNENILSDIEITTSNLTTSYTQDDPSNTEVENEA
jgi:hypothetical protein